MTILRPECRTARPGEGYHIPDDTALYLIADSVARRRVLIHGRLHDGKGHHCAMGCFWEDNPNATVSTRLIDEVAAVNDSIPKTATAQERWKKVIGWLRWKLKFAADKRQNK